MADQTPDTTPVPDTSPEATPETLPADATLVGVLPESEGGPKAETNLPDVKSTETLKVAGRTLKAYTHVDGRRTIDAVAFDSLLEYVSCGGDLTMEEKARVDGFLRGPERSGLVDTTGKPL